VLSLEANLLYSWQQVFLIGRELTFLQELSISHNLLRPLEKMDELYTYCGVATQPEEETKEGNDQS
jgi:hypothetical protein